MTTWHLFAAVLSALLVNEAVQKIIAEVSWRIHEKKHGSIWDRLEKYTKPEDTE
jgi:hypothetical protein